ncbi:nucleotidyltransferase family protein [Pseudonocardia oroxyli]|uniref:Nucleotidyltransferase family protein n=1 Tax=Pseudonocardia oroxyli TaxID=366584 RepID=A0A1G8CCE0_PSEOR|nr:nucleotidyltransferase family protein [Pseudonocardia oroxyli]SDH43065.1 hypothetical protein SAMN05216377_12257 [Pseudonocardia oroxyli]
MDSRSRFLDLALQNPVIVAVLERAPALGVPDWWLAAGALSQTVWNVLHGRDPGAGIADYDLVYFDDTDLSYDAENTVIGRATEVLGDVAPSLEIRNQARVHLWYQTHFGEPGLRFTSSTHAIDHFPTTTTSVGLSRTAGGEFTVYAPFGLDDILAMRVRPNPRLAPRTVYETKTRRWKAEWPNLLVEPWPEPDDRAG